MPYESTSRTKRGPLSSLRRFLFGERQTPQFAHPWTAYAPAHFNAIPSASGTTETSEIQPVVVLPAPEPSPPIRLPEASQPKPQPVKLQLVASKSLDVPAPAATALSAATGQDFQFAARLRSVDILNRPSAAPVAKSTYRKRAGQNRPIKTVVTAKRTRNITPPAVQRRQRKSAQIIHLKLALARAQHKQLHSSKVA